jgi:hypothetical protein
MRFPAQRVPQKFGFWATFIALTLASAVAALGRTFSEVELQDDEGSLMYALRAFMNGGVLYDHVRTLYGPLFYLFQGFARKVFGVPLSHDSTRAVSALVWVTAALVLFVLVYRATGSLAIATAAHFLGFRALRFLGFEALHPQDLCILLLICLVLSTLGRRSVTMACFGGLTAAAFLVKVNLGIFITAALAITLGFGLRQGWFRRLVLPLCVCAALLLPPVLMSAQLSETWALRYSLLVSISLLSAVFAARTIKTEPLSIRQFGIMAGAGLATAIVLLVPFLLHGSTLRGLYESMVVWPRESFANHSYLPLRVSTPAVLWAVCGLPLAWLTAQRQLPYSAVAILKIVMAIAILLGVHSENWSSIINSVTPMIWLVAVPATSTGNQENFLRPFLAVLGVLQTLYAYPTAGSQTPFTAVLMIGIAAISLWDAMVWVAPAVPDGVVRRVPAVAVGLILILECKAAYHEAGYYQSLSPLAMPGARFVRIERYRAEALQRLIDASRQCSMLATVPGLPSLNIFSGSPPPPSLSGFHFNSWTSFSRESDQIQAVHEFADQSRPCAVYNPEIAALWGRGPRPPGPFVDYVLGNFHVAFEAQGYKFMVR